MELSKIKERINFLVESINEHNRRYYEQNAPTISDYEFDMLLKELEQLEGLYPEYIRSDSPTSKVGSDLASDGKSPFKQYPHKYPMLSLANSYNIGELRDFDARVRKSTSENFTYNCELKFDGTGINLLYRNGILVRALTRGDGTQGDDVLRNIKTIKSIPARLSDSGNIHYPPEFEIRGEIYMPFEQFDKLNAQKELNQETLFANPRNAAAGSLKILDPDVVAQRGLQCVLYHLIAPQNVSTEHSQALKIASEWGLPISEYSKVCKDIEEVIEYLMMWDIKRKELPFPTDGMVVKVNQFALQSALGFTAKTPRWAVAYKFKPEQALTKIESIDYQVGRTGAITPVANLTPVLLSGTTIKRATLHNADQMELLDIHLGDWVYIEKGGEIIPKITAVERSKREPYAKKAIFPKTCPICGSLLYKDAEQAKYFCPNTNHCPPQIQGKFIHFCSRKALNINLGEVAIEQMWERGYIHRLEDLYNLSDLQLLSLDKWKEKSVENFRNSLEKSYQVPFSRVLFGLGIRNIGETTAKNLAKRFGSVDALKNAKREELIAIDDVGETLADCIIDYFASEENIATVEALKKAGLQFESHDNLVVSNELAGMTIMITGTYSIPRDTMKHYIESHGGKVGTSVTSSTTYLLAGDKAGDAKLKKAEKLGIPIISEEEFYRIAASPATSANEPVAKLHRDEKNDNEELTLF